MYILPLLLLSSLALLVIILVKLNKKNSEPYLTRDSPAGPDPCPLGDKTNLYCQLAVILNNYLFDAKTATDLMTYFNNHSSEIAGLVQSLSGIPDKATIGTITLTKGQGNSLVFYGCGRYLMSQANSPDSISDCPF